MAREQLVNNAITYLVGAINDSVTSFTVSDASAFPSVGDFVVMLGLEIIQVTDVTGTTFTCVRGYESSSATSHNDGAVVAHIITAGSLLRHIRNTVPLFSESNIPLLNTLVDKSDTILTASSFTAINQGTSTLTDYSSGGVALYVPAASSDNVRVWKKTAPAIPASASSLIVAVRGIVPTSDGMFGIGYRESDTGKMFVMAFRHAGTTAQKWTSPTVFVANVGENYGGCGDFIWLKVGNDGTNLKSYFSSDGISWTETHSEAWSGWMSGAGPDEICLAGNDTVNVGSFASYSAWLEA